MRLPVLNDQVEVCLIAVVVTFCKGFAGLHQESTLTLICIHDVRCERLLRSCPHR